MTERKLKLISLFSGAGGMDLGFKQAGFEIVWANDNDRQVRDTFVRNFPETEFDGRDISKIKSEEVPDGADGFIGGPPCGSWSCAGSNKGLDDQRGKMFLEYLRIINDKNPKFFMIENVEGILRKTHQPTFDRILTDLRKCGNGYDVHYRLLNASDYEVPQDRLRVFFVGFRSDLVINPFEFPEASDLKKLTLDDAIRDLEGLEIPHDSEDSRIGVDKKLSGYTYLNSDWSSQFMSRNRVRKWNQQAYTVPASGRHITIHPQAPVMKKVGVDKFEFVGDKKLYRRFTLRECARIQTFPDEFELVVKNVSQGYKLIGNAVPVMLAFHMANSIKRSLII